MKSNGIKTKLVEKRPDVSSIRVVDITSFGIGNSDNIWTVRSQILDCSLKLLHSSNTLGLIKSDIRFIRCDVFVSLVDYPTIKVSHRHLTTWKSRRCRFHSCV